MRSLRSWSLALLLLAVSACEPACVPNPSGPPPSSLRRVHIETAGGAPVLNTEDYVDATIRVVAPGGAEEVTAPTRIRGRGNATWAFAKKPYRLRLDAGISLAGMPADRDWALLAHYLDKTLVRTRLAMDLGDELGMAYSSRSEFVEFYFNGVYQGVYELFEHLEVAPHKINVPQLDPDVDAAPEVITGGYHIEVDHYLDEAVCWMTARGIPICAKDPELDPNAISAPNHPSAAQYAYITNLVNEAEAAINTPGDSYAEYFDVDAMVDWYLISELLRNADSRIVGVGRGAMSSVHLHKDRDGNLVFGPLWDFDRSADSAPQDSSGWWIRQSEWFSPLFAHSSFGQEVFSTWCQLRDDGVLDSLPARVDALVAEIGPVAIAGNVQRWPGIMSGTTYDAEVARLKTWLSARAEWMDDELQREFGSCPTS